MTSYSTLTETISYCFQVTASYLSKVADFNLAHLHLAPQLGVTMFAILVEHRLVTDKWTDTLQQHILS